MASATPDPYEHPFIPPVYYPESDGKPMAETDSHLEQILALRYGFQVRLSGRQDAYVASNLLLYYVEGDPAKRVAPDVFVVLGVPAGSRRIYRLWEEGRGPSVVVEVTSKGTRDEDLGTKKGLYEFLGVAEYFLVDPLAEYLEPPLQGFRLGDGGYVPLVGRSLRCETLGLDLRHHGDMVRLFDAETGALIPTPTEERARAESEAARAESEAARAESEAARAQSEAARAESETARAESEAARAESEAARADAAERELERLSAELARLRG